MSHVKRKGIRKFVPRVPKRVAKLRPPRIPLLNRGRTAESDAKLHEAIQNLPRITNETVAEHREEVLSSARKYIYPLSHSKRKVLTITTSILITAVIVFFSYCIIALYKMKSSSTFIYGVTQVIPFPVGHIGTTFISYESYLFELRHTGHYYQVQGKVNFNDPSGKQVKERLQQQAMKQVIDDAYVKKLAAQHKVSVSNQEVTNELDLVRSQNRLGSNDQVFRDVLSEFWGWTPDDFKRELKQELLAQKVAAKMDTATQNRAQSVLKQADAGADFAALAKLASDDTTTQPNGGDYGGLIDKSNRNVPPQVVDAIFSLQPGQHTAIINAGQWLEIDKLIEMQGDKAHAAHIVFNLKPISTYIDPLKAKQGARVYISVKPAD